MAGRCCRIQRGFETLLVVLPVSPIHFLSELHATQLILIVSFQPSVFFFCFFFFLFFFFYI